MDGGQVQDAWSSSIMFRGLELRHRYDLEERKSPFGPQETESVNVRT